MMAFGLGIAPSQSMAALDGLLHADVTFIRTPKQGSTTSPHATRAEVAGPGRPWSRRFTLALAVYMFAAIAWAIGQGIWASVPFLALFAIGFSYVGVHLVRDHIRTRPRRAGGAAGMDAVPATK